MTRPARGGATDPDADDGPSPEPDSEPDGGRSPREGSEVPPGFRLSRTVTALVVAGAVVTIGLLGVLAMKAGVATAIAAAVLVVIAVAVALRRFERLDALVLCTVLLLLVPARYRIAPLGAAGTPAALIGLLAWALWLLGLVTNPGGRRRPRAIRWTLLGLVLTVLLSYVAAAFRPHDNLEAKAADRGLFTLLGMVGITLFAAELVNSRAALDRVVRAVVGTGAVVAALGVLQFFTAVDLAALVTIPGFTYVPADYDNNRAGFTRIIATVSHPIELSVVLAMLLPLALHVAFTATRKRRRWWLCTALIGASIPMTVSRTGIVGLVVALAVSMPFWSGRRRAGVLLGTVLGIGAMRLVIPGLIGTLRSFLFNPGQDPSLYSREVGRARALGYWAERPWLGRGFGTFLPQRYTYLDNQMLLSLVETGVLGLAANMAVFVTAVVMVFQTRSRASGPRREHDRALAAALLASLTVSFSSWFTYDALSFPTSRELTLLVVGLIAAQWVVVAGQTPRRAPARREQDALSASRAGSLA